MNKFKKLIYVGAMALAVLSIQVIGSTVNKTNVYADTTTSNYEVVSLNNSNFSADSTDTTNLNTNPSSWTSIEDYGTTTKGVINTKDSFASFSSNYKMAGKENPGHAGDDNQVLMINSQTDANNFSATHGFKSSDILLAAHSDYAISVSVKTMDNAKASVVLSGLNNNDVYTDIEEQYFSGLTNIAWKTYTFYISTNYETPSVNLELYLGNISANNKEPSAGIVFFDNVNVLKCSNGGFYSTMEDNSTEYYNYIQLTHYFVPQTNFDFESGTTGWTKIGNYTPDTIHTATATKDNDLGLDNTANNTKALVLSSENNLYVGFKSTEIEIKQNGYYRISLNVKTSDISGNAYATLVETDYLKDNYNFTNYEPKTSSLSISTNNTKAITNNYSTFEFYVSGHELYDTKVNLELSLGNSTTDASGKVAFDNVKVEYIPFTVYDNVSVSSLIQMLDLTTITGTPTFTNGYFNIAHSETTTPSYPLTPDSWTSTTNNSSAIFGVVNPAKWSEIDSAKKPTTNPLNPSLTIGGLTIPVSDTASNNIMMLYNKTATYQKVESDTFSISSDSYYTLSFNYQARGGEVLNLTILDDSDNVIYKDFGLSNDAWKYYKLTINTEYYTSTLKMVFELGTKTDLIAGSVFLDNFQLVKETYDDATYNTLVNNDENVLDFSNAGMNLTGDQINGKKMYEALMYKSTLADNNGQHNIAFGGIINEDNDYNIAFPSTHTSSVQNMLVIQNLGLCDYSFTSKDSVSLETDKYYKFTIYIKTVFNDETLNTKDIDFGAYVSLIGITDASINHIKTDTLFKQYAIYVKSDSASTVQIKFGLRSQENIDTIGTAFFDTYTFETIEKADYTSAVSTPSTLLVNDIGVEDEEDEEVTPPQQGQVNIWIMISTLIMVLAMVIAIVGALLRKVEVKKFKVKRQAEYDRQATLVRDVAFAEAEKRRNEEIKTLQKEKEQLKVYIQELDDDNKQRINSERQSNGKQITRKSEHEFKVYVSHRQKLVKDVDKIDQRIKEAETPEYLMRIVKVVQNEKVKEVMNKEPKKD